MFFVSSIYLKSQEEIDPLLASHADWLRTQHEEGVFVASGSQVPRTGGAILALGVSRERLETILAMSPLALAGAVQYSIQEIHTPEAQL